MADLSAFSVFRGNLAPIAALGALTLAASPLSAQEAAEETSGDYLEALKACQTITEDTARLECFDTAVGSMVTASEAGDVQVVDREDIRQTRRGLFGFSLPNLGIFGGGDDEDEELFTTTITNVRYFTRRHAQFTTEEGAVWEMRNIPRRMRTIDPGDSVEFKEASFGYYFVRVEGQTGVKGRRIQ